MVLHASYVEHQQYIFYCIQNSCSFYHTSHNSFVQRNFHFCVSQVAKFKKGFATILKVFFFLVESDCLNCSSAVIAFLSV